MQVFFLSKDDATVELPDYSLGRPQNYVNIYTAENKAMALIGR